MKSGHSSSTAGGGKLVTATFEHNTQNLVKVKMSSPCDLQLPTCNNMSQKQISHIHMGHV